MLPITEISITESTLIKLAAFQTEVDAIAIDAKWKKKLDATWKKYTNSTDFQEVKDKLAAMCPGRKRCCYCEDSEAEGIDHINPKVLFPNFTFSWANYLYACAICNKKKSDNWALFVSNGASRSFYKIPRYQSGGARIFPKGNNDGVFINPRTTDPTTFMQLVIDPRFDKVDFYPIVATLSAHDQIRADFTIKTLKLNSVHRPNLAKSRMDAYHDYYARLNTYLRCKFEENYSQAQLELIIARFKKRNHPTVWFEIKRLFGNGMLARIDAAFHELLTKVPEAFTW